MHERCAWCDGVATRLYPPRTGDPICEACCPSCEYCDAPAITRFDHGPEYSEDLCAGHAPAGAHV